MAHIAFDYSVSKSTVCESIKWVEDTLVKSKEFAISSKRKFIEDGV
ncbi:MAG: hypothetical protein IJ667_10505 [Synergistaceae bacterium]|nr:hypothetical protein [Synergistaceae bacterium]